MKIKEFYRKYKNIFLFCTFVVLFILDLLHYVNGIKDDFSRSRVERSLYVLYPIMAAYFVYLTWKNYKKNKPKPKRSKGGGE